MLHAMRKRAERDEEGFTLIELMVVVLIIAILLAIAIPTFLGARKRANDRAAQSSLRNAATAAKTMFTDTQSFAAADSSATGLSTVEGSLTYVAGASADVAGPPAVPSYKVVSVLPVVVAATGQNDWFAAVLSKSGTCFYIKESATGNTQYSTGATCTATAASGAGVTWSGSWS